MAKILSGKAKKTPPTQVSEKRYEFLELSEAEPDLGVPSAPNQVLSSSEVGVRQWVNVKDVVSLVTVSSSPPTTPIAGDLWWDSSDGTMKIYYDDGSSVQWVATNPGNVGSQSFLGKELALYFRGKTTDTTISIPNEWLTLVNTSTITVHLTVEGPIPVPDPSATYLPIPAVTEITNTTITIYNPLGLLYHYLIIGKKN